MKITDLMTKNVRTCTPDTNLAAAGALMLDGDCGLLPVVTDGRLTGVITDRDICIALATRNGRASDLAVGDVAQSPVVTCNPDDDVHLALALMQRHRIRRLPVVGFAGTVAGIVSMNDLVRAAGPHEAVHDDDIAETLRAVCTHHLPAAHVTTA